MWQAEDIRKVKGKRSFPTKLGSLDEYFQTLADNSRQYEGKTGENLSLKMQSTLGKIGRKKTQNETNQVIYDHSKSCPQELNKGLLRYSTCKDERRKCFSLISCVFPTSAPLSIDPLYKHRPVFLHTTLSTKSASIKKQDWQEEYNVLILGTEVLGITISIRCWSFQIGLDLDFVQITSLSPIFGQLLHFFLNTKTSI